MVTLSHRPNNISCNFYSKVKLHKNGRGVFTHVIITCSFVV